ncbi:MAG TPA: hypothetical protein VHL31_03300 [Geminicoccus sp.]|uniref:hypothetical protein n=1 Tax=Geminicoccus sp. TaxID=2024832 RepID=UPI002E2EC28F|nr:hypothetical protein [Geminicoccus sp.]HEX2525313.1 hypothetical protein [Geminicoccus sp.]
MQPLAVNDIVRECWSFFLHRWKDLAQAASLPFVMLLLLSVLVRGMMGPMELPDTAAAPETATLPPGIGALFIVKFLEGLVLASLAVALHRAVLLDEPLPPVLWIHARSLRYALRAIGLLLASAVPTMVIFLLAMILGGGGMAAIQLAILPSMFATLFVICRLHPVLTSNAIDLKGTFSAAWEQTKGQGFRLMLGAIVLLAPLMVGGTLLLLIVAGQFEGVPILQNIPQAVALLTDLAEVALLAIYFSFAWRRLSRPEQPVTTTSI